VSTVRIWETVVGSSHADQADRDDDGGRRNGQPETLASGEVEPPADRLRLGADHPRVVEPGERREHAEDGSCGEDRGEHGHEHADAEEEREPLDGGLTGDE
jgi:hypothetical protein